jgi:hypothetical protein
MDTSEKKRKAEALAALFGDAPSQKQPKLNFKVLTKEEYTPDDAIENARGKKSSN